MAEETVVIGYQIPNGQIVQLRDLPWDEVAKIEKAHNVSWLVVIDAPQTNSTVMVDLARLVHHLHGLNDPTPATVRDAVDLAVRFRVLDAATGLPFEVPEEVVELADEDIPEIPSLDEWQPTSL